MSKLSLQMKRNIFHYRTGTLLNQKHAVRFKMSTSLQNPLCQQADSALHILSGCQYTLISGMITERHNFACRLIMKAISKGSLAGCLVHLDADSTDRLAQQNLQIPEHAYNKTQPSGLLDARSSAIDSPLVIQTPSWSLAYLLKDSNCQPFLVCTRCHTQDKPAEMNPEFTSSISIMREIRLVEVKYCEDARPGHQ